MKDAEDFWADDAFEDTVAAALIACFETKVKKNRGAAPADRLTDERLAILRNSGPYIASPSRWLIGPESLDHGNWSFDLSIDKLPVSGHVAHRPTAVQLADRPGAYLLMNYIRQAGAMGRYWHKRKGGTLYEMLTTDAGNDGINGERRFFTVAPSGEVVACTQRIANNLGYQPGARVSQVEPDEAWLHETSVWAGVALQLLADNRHCWTITAQEKAARAHLGCMMEEVKSLLYARSLPMTATGRKRPILHLVESHKRRMRSGTDVDVTAFLRGQQTVEIAGTVFKVNPPATLRPEVSKPSRERYYAAVEA